MNKIIITGATGFIGSSFVQYLLKLDLKVLALGRKNLQETKFDQKTVDSELFTYLKIDMKDINSLSEKLQQINWQVGDSCVFYNFAWEGKKNLTDGDINDQIKNVEFSAKAVEASCSIGCKKFVNIGSQEEKFIERYLVSNKWRENAYHSNMGVYAVAKLASKDMCKLISYLNKIDYIHARFSTIIDTKNLDSGYISSVFKNILNNNDFDSPKNPELIDIISIEDAVKAFYEIGLKGENKDEFYIGSGNPKTLLQYFTEFSAFVNKDNIVPDVKKDKSTFILNEEDFNIDYLYKKTAFKAEPNIYSKILNRN